MPYKLTRTISKREEDLWYIHINSNTSLNTEQDPRDLIIYSENESGILSSYLQKIKENINDYVGWNREYVGNNTLLINNYFGSESSARLCYSRIMMNPPLLETEAIRGLYKQKKKQNNINVQYTETWSLQDENGNNLNLN
jgi:hypothetical protein